MGLQLAIMKGFLGLSGTVPIQVYQIMFNGNPTAILLILALLPTSISLLLMYFVRVYHTDSGEDKKLLNGFSSVAWTLASYLLVLILLENFLIFPLWAIILKLILLLLLLVSPLIVVVKAQEDESGRLPQLSFIGRSHLISDRVESKKCSVSDDEFLLGNDMNLLQASCSLDFWLLFIAMLCGMGSGVAMVNNINQIGQSLDYSTKEINMLVSLRGIWNFLGRIGAGYVSDLLLYNHGWARPSFMTFTLATMALGYMIFTSGFLANLYFESILVGVSYGSQWTLMPAITCEIFGVTHMGTIFNTITVANPIRSSVLSILVIGYIYDTETSAEGNKCYGSHCFMLSFFCVGFC